jgi:hypothetical protein
MKRATSDYFHFVDTEVMALNTRERSEFYANIQLAMSQATPREGAHFRDPAPIRAIVKRSFSAYIRAILSSLF